MKINTTNAGATFEYCGQIYITHEVVFSSNGRIELSGNEVSIGTLPKFESDPDVLTTFDWAYAKQNSKYRIKKIQRNPKKNATTVIFENGHVEVVKRNELDPEADLYSVVAYAVAKYVYGSNSAFKRQIRDCIFESLEVK